MNILRVNQHSGKTKRHRFFTVLATVLVLIFAAGMMNCGKKGGKTTKNKENFYVSKDEIKNDSITEDGRAKEDEEKKKTQKSGIGLIREVKITPVGGTVDSEFRVIVRTTKALTADQFITFKFWRNGEVMDERDEGVIPPFSLKKNDRLFADVIVHDGAQVIAIKRTDTLLIQNSPPKITQFFNPEIKGPGTYELGVDAEDIDGDQLVFTLESENPPVNSIIDPISGNVTFTLPSPPPTLLVLVVAVNDGDNGTARKKYTMKLGPPKKTQDHKEDPNRKE